ncbi:unnamed protein product [Diplocarpon coronariae]|nr:hypothetical protein JHW43_004251 [Diplocarpon mali]
MARLVYRWKEFMKRKRDDVLMPVAGLGAVQYGSGLRMQNVPRAWEKMHWHVCSDVLTAERDMRVIQTDTYTPNSNQVLQHTASLFLVSSSRSASVSSKSMPILSNLDPTDMAPESGSVYPYHPTYSGALLRILNRVRLRYYGKRIVQLAFCATLLGMICWFTPSPLQLPGVHSLQSTSERDLKLACLSTMLKSD